MVKADQAIILSAFLVALLSIPAASEEVKIDKNTEEGFEATIDTKFTDKFSYSMKSGLEKMRLVESSSEFRMEERPSRRVKSIETPSGSLEVIRENDSVVRKTVTPYGTLKTGIRNGRRFASFEGLNRSRVESIRSSLMDRLGESRREAEAKRRSVMNEILPEVDLVVTEGGESEHVNITNTDNKTLDLKGWSFTNLEGDVYTIDQKLDEGETFTFYPKDYSSSIEDSVSGTDVTLYSTGGEIELRNSEGYLIATEDY